MRSKARDYKETTLKKLYLMSHNECAFPGCTQSLAREDRDDFTVNICHIEAAEAGGQRYNPNSNDDYRRSYENLILLCANHHIETNDEKKYPIEALKRMKLDHHILMIQRASRARVLNTHSSVLGEVINLISSSDLLSSPGQADLPANFAINDKISHNNVIRYKPVIEEYAVYQGKLTNIYAEIEKQGSYKKEQLLQNIKSLYLAAKGKILNGDESIGNIQAKADDLIKEVEDELWDLVEKRSSNLSIGISYEAISVSLLIVLVDAFMRCKILEEPPKK
jgi:hypothetical protein